ncbi:hypothetical protein C6558_32030 [Ensifer sp. NM-2]|nr:hypothetical protein C6558_32030 [Ensifer sp. NM-2]
MNTMEQIEPPKMDSEIARIVFSMFVYASDVEKRITAHEVRKFQVLIRDTTWVESDDLRNALFELLERYSSFWADYEDEVFKVDAGTISAAIEQVKAVLGDERTNKLRTALGKFIDRLAVSAYGAKLVEGEQKLRAQARKDLGSILGKGYGSHQAPVLERRLDPSAASVVARTSPEPIVAPVASTSVWPATALAPGRTGVWAGKTVVRCVSVVWETADTKTYSFVSDPPALFHYKPGQFVGIEVALPTGALRRSYTISSSPSRPYTLSITVKKVPMGWMSNWLFDNMVEGFECAISGPAGKFTCFDHPSKKLLFMAAGSGITPTMSMLRWLVDTASDADIVFINNVRTPDDIIFHQELLHLSTRLSGKLKLAIVPAAASPARPWHGPTGKLDEMLLRTYVPDLIEREAFVCGPPGYMAAAKALLMQMGLPSEKYHDESFGGAPAAAPTVVKVSAEPSAAMTPSLVKDSYVSSRLGTTASSSQARLEAAIEDLSPSLPRAAANAATGVNVKPKAFTGSLEPSPSNVTPIARAVAAPILASPSAFAKTEISIEGTSKEFSASSGQTILDAADAAGVNLPHSCRAGVCGACKMRKVSGDVQMDSQTALSPQDLSAGFILACVGKARGKVVIAL